MEGKAQMLGRLMQINADNFQILGDFCETFSIISVRPAAVQSKIIQWIKCMQNLQKLGWFLFIASFLLWLAILFIVPFLPLSIAEKTQIDVVLAVLAEVCFWLSVVILGKEVVTKYRGYLNPRYLWNKIRNFNRR